MRESVRDMREVTISSHRALMIWAYLTGCTNWNLIEDGEPAGYLNRPAYTPMYKYDREMFPYTNRGQDA